MVFDVISHLQVHTIDIHVVHHSHFSFQLADAITCKWPKVYFPPQLDTLLAWSTTFRSAGTLSNYLGYVKTGCLIVGASTEVGFCLLTVTLLIHVPV